MKQKEIYLANLNPTKGSEQKGTRPVVIISGEAMNQHLGVVIICPLSSKIKNYSACVQIKKDNKTNIQCDSEIITFQIRTIAKSRLIKKIGTISDKTLKEIFQGLSDIFTF